MKFCTDNTLSTFGIGINKRLIATKSHKAYCSRILILPLKTILKNTTNKIKIEDMNVDIMNASMLMSVIFSILLLQNLI